MANNCKAVFVKSTTCCFKTTTETIVGIYGIATPTFPSSPGKDDVHFIKYDDALVSYIYDGTSWVVSTVTTLSVTGATPVTDIFEIFIPTNTVTLTSTPLSSYHVLVFRGGLRLRPDEYTISGTNITFSIAFGMSGNGALGEEVTVDYCI